MVRRIASQVHKQASRLLRANYLKQRPVWYQAVLDHPPLPLPARAPPPRSSYDTSSKKHAAPLKKTPGPRPLPIAYIEDDIRRQFFRDHPFEAFRARTLTEDGAIEEEHPIQGAQWTRLRQRGRNPTPEDAIRFAVHLHEHHGHTLSDAYSTAIGQFRSLRAEHQIATRFAAQEAEAYGAVFGPSVTERGHAAEARVIAENALKKEQMDEGELVARKRWRMIAARGRGAGAWSRGEEYVRLWKEGVRPDYSPALTEPIVRAGFIQQSEQTEQTEQTES
ncbi:hypothetical protein BV25DRAFT_1868177 [Artomyces pyxidatus]|uniref:Uncharacterized protein n=1 Tax=Artomyces pyxidatus TaxID=48021 RepID=A0ACB8TDI5_9AGAM|nr:hypothetical protein BV25DRAFT_1868177 [Artomyces pyxidatus]